MAGTIEDRIAQVVEPLITSMGLEVWGLVFRRGGNHRARLQIFIEKEGGVTADDCQEATRVISPALDAADLIGPAYVLEVSSPGLDRLLFNEKQLALYQGKTVKLELRLPMEGRRRFEGRLLEIGGDGMFKIEDKDLGLMELSWSNVQSCRLVPDFSKEQAL